MSHSCNVLRLAAIMVAATLLSACASMAPRPWQPQGPDLSGEWVLTTRSQVGAQDARMTVRQNGTALAGTISDQGNSVDYTGSVNGSAVAFDFILNVNGADLKVDYSGTVEGDTMKGKMLFGQIGEGTFTATRK